MCLNVRWVFQLVDFDFEIEHRSGTRLACVDALSRNPVCSLITIIFFLKLKTAQEQDDEIRGIKEILLIKPYNIYSNKSDFFYEFLDG